MSKEEQVQVDDQPENVSAQATKEEAIAEQDIKTKTENLQTDTNSDVTHIEQLEARLLELEKNEKEIILRTKAEIENIKRRASLDVEKAHKFALEKFSKELLVVIDNLERAIEVTTDHEDEKIKPLFDGVELTLKSLLDIVNKFGIISIGEVGEIFNPEQHQAIATQRNDNLPTKTIISVLQKGYLLNNRVIRPAMVIVNQ